MEELVYIGVLFYGIPVLCALIGFYRTGKHNDELEALRVRVSQLESRLADASSSEAASASSSEVADAAFSEGADAAFSEGADAAFSEGADASLGEPSLVSASTISSASGATSIEQALPDEASPEQAAPQAMPSPDPQDVSAVPPASIQDAGKPQIPGVLVTLWGWFRANPILYIGLGVFLTGMAFALNYLTFHGYLTVEARLGAAALVGAGFLGGGWKLRLRNAQVAQVLMGGGAVILYLTLFMTARLQVLGAGTVFGCMAALVIGTTLLAVKVDAHLLAVLSTAGGFAVPVLLATESGNHVGLFSYYALLSAGNLLLLRFRAWDIPALVSFAAVGLVGGLWARDAYLPAMFMEMEGFLILFFLIFSAIHLQLLRHAQDRPGLSQRLVHASYLFGLPLAVFGCQYLLVRPYPYADAASALVLAVWHLSLRFVYRKEAGAAFGLVRDAFLILGVGFSALCVPLALHAPWITCTWALQGAGLVWLGLRQARRSLQWSGYALQLFGLFDLLRSFDQLQIPVPGGITNGFVIGVATLCLCGLVILRELHIRRGCPGEASPQAQKNTYAVAQVWGLLLWWLVVYFQMDTLSVTTSQWFNGLVFCTACSAFVWFLAGRRLGLDLWQYPVQGIWVLLIAYLPAPVYWGVLFRPAEGNGMIEALKWANGSILGLLIFPMTHYAMRRAPELWRGGWLSVSLVGLWLLAVFFGVYQWADVLYRGLTINAYAALFWMLLPVALLLTGLPWVLRRLASFPVYARSGGAVYRTLGWVLLVWMLFVFAVLCGYDGRTLSGYTPVFSWVDATQILLLGAVASLYRRHALWSGKLCGIAGFGLFALVTVMAARTVSVLTGVSYETGALLHDPAFRFVLSVLWGGMALGLMLAASRILKGEARRPLWYAGAALLLLTILKLLLLDMADRSTVYRMVSFLSLGALMLSMGYFCPLPPKATQDS